MLKVDVGSGHLRTFYTHLNYLLNVTDQYFLLLRHVTIQVTPKAHDLLQLRQEIFHVTP